MANLELEAKLAAAELPLNETVYRDCPVCNGRNKFSVTRTREGVLWNCFKASCSVRGFSPLAGELLKPNRKPNKLRPYRGSLRLLEPEHEQFFRERFPGLCTEQLELLRWAPEDDRWAFPILDPRGYCRGWTLRAYDGRDPKSLTRMHADGPSQSWHEPGWIARNSDWAHKVVLVEDQMSAMVCASAGMSACALLGTQLNNDKVREIAMQRPREVLLALDADATEEAFRLARRWGLAFERIRVVVLKRDLKEEQAEDIREVLGL